MGLVTGKWIVHKRVPGEGFGSKPWAVYTPQGLEMYIFNTWREAMAVASVMTSMTTYTHIDYDTDHRFGGGYVYDLDSFARLRVNHELVRTSWVINKKVVRRDFDNWDLNTVSVLGEPNLSMKGYLFEDVSSIKEVN